MTTLLEDDTAVNVTVSALDAGHITLPEHLFVADSDPSKFNTVPSLAFLIQHPSAPPSRNHGGVTNLVFDLGVKRDLTGYAPAIQPHIAKRQPITTNPDCADSLRSGGLDPARDVDFVILSHVHWDHVGTSSDFSGATFAVGSGTLDLLQHGAGPLYPAEQFNDDELPRSRTVEFPPVPREDGSRSSTTEYHKSPHAPHHTPAPSDIRLPRGAHTWEWKSIANSIPHALDLFSDGSVYVIDSPGHLYGHVNLLARLARNRYVYLGGDCCHDSRILRGEKGIAPYPDGRGGQRSVHTHTETARQTLDRIGKFMKERKIKGQDIEVEVVLAHDGKWREDNKERFWPRKL